MIDWIRDDTPWQDDPLWYKDAIIYQLHVRAFRDSNGDGIGDFRGLTEKLDYLQDLGVTALWLLPFYPSPLRDDGYDIADYTDVHPNYGTLEDFETFLREAHRRGLRVITELVINHTSGQHPWFQRSRRARPGSRWRDFYVWSDTPEKYSDARIIFKDFESSNWRWDSTADAFYWHRFFSHQPDLNYANPEVHEAVFEAMDFWLDRGVDGLRLDAIPYLYEREGTTCENLPETHAFLKKLRERIDAKYQNRMLLAEANQWPEDAVAYFGDGDECHMAFHFPVMPRLFMAVRMEDRFPVVDILQQTPEIPETCQWAIFLRNHDELTLEMVTDEERDYMYKTYARDPQARINLGIRRRLAPLMETDRRRMELLSCLLFSLPGTPVIYYGDEIGMGDNIYLGDRNGVRTPMQWSPDRNAGFSPANPQQLYLPTIIDPQYHYEAVNVELQQKNPYSLLWWMKRHIALRKRYRVFSRGSLEFLDAENNKVLAFVRRYEDEELLVVANLSRFAQDVELNLSSLEGKVPTELLGGTEFVPIEASPYRLNLGPYAFYWFLLEPQAPEEPVTVPAPEVRIPTLTVTGTWKDVFQGHAKRALERALPAYLEPRTWFDGNGRTLRTVTLSDTLPVAETSYLTLVEAEFADGEFERYVVPLAFATGDRAYELQQDFPGVVIARLQTQERSEEGVLYDAMWESDFCESLLEAVAQERSFRGPAGQVRASTMEAFEDVWDTDEPLEPGTPISAEGHTSVIYGDQFVLKLFRRLEQGVNPDLEIGLFLTEQTSFENAAPVAGALEYRVDRGEPMTLAILRGFVPNAGDAWDYTLDVLGRYFEQVLTRPRDGGELETAPVPAQPLLSLTRRELPAQADELLGTYEESVQLLGQRTAELHLALASDSTTPAFAPEPFTALYARPLYQSLRNPTRRTFRLLRRLRRRLPEAVRADAQRVLDSEEEILKHYHAVLERKITARRIRCHGDYNLKKILYTGKDFIVTDFEGEPSSSLTERRRKRVALRDVASMLRSFHYAAYTALLEQVDRGLVSREDQPALETWARYWYLWVGATFLKAYLEVAREASFVPQAWEELQVLLDVHMLERAADELNYELNHRFARVTIPLRGILQPLESEPPA